MKTLLVYILALFHGGVLASAWWGAAWFGWGKLDMLWAIPVIGTTFTLIILGVTIHVVLDSN
jgi:hypothetical protein